MLVLVKLGKDHIGTVKYSVLVLIRGMTLRWVVLEIGATINNADVGDYKCFRVLERGIPH